MIFEEDFAQKNNERVSIQCLLQKGTVHPRAHTPAHYHYHTFAELLYVTAGVLTVYAGEDRFDLKQGDLVLLAAGLPHTTAHTEGTQNYVIKFLPDILASSEQTSKEFEYVYNLTHPVNDPVMHDNGQLLPLVLHAYESYCGNGYADELFLRADVVRLCAEIMERLNESGRRLPFRATDAITEGLKNVIRVLNKSNGNLRMQEAARLCGFSDAYFSKKFKQAMGKGFTAYAREIRLAEAERLLKCTDASVNMIAEALQYATASHFIEDFRKAKKISPLKYRRQFASGGKNE